MKSRNSTPKEPIKDPLALGRQKSTGVYTNLVHRIFASKQKQRTFLRLGLVSNVCIAKLRIVMDNGVPRLQEERRVLVHRFHDVVMIG